MPIGNTRSDLVTLGRLGARWLELAGAGERDVLLSVLPPGPSVAHWQLVQGARAAGVPSMHLDPTLDSVAERVAELAPSVVAGRPADLVRVFRQWEASGQPLTALTVLCIGEGGPPSPDERAAVSALAGGATVVIAWAPDGARALWTECRPAAVAAVYDRALVPSLHTWPACEVLETDEDDRLLWTAVGWAGSPLLRLRTDAMATVEVGPCPYCGVAGVQLHPVLAGTPA